MEMENRATAAFPNEKWLFYHEKDSNNSFLSFPVSHITDRISFGSLIWSSQPIFEVVFAK